MSAQTITNASELDRRQLLTAAGGLLLAFTLEGGGRAALAAGTTAPTGFPGFIHIAPDGSVTVFVGGGEMGQGIYSGLAQCAAEDLMVDWNQVKVQPIDAAHSWFTGGSSGITRHSLTLRTAGATARDMLITAAAQLWSVPFAECSAAHGAVVHPKKGKLTYGQLANAAANVTLAQPPALVPSSAFRLIGQPVPRPDLPAKTDGSAQYGIDIHLPGMVFATIQHCPVLGGTFQGIQQPPSGVTLVPLGNAVAIVAPSTWEAMRVEAELQVDWNIPASAQSVDSGVFLAQARQLLRQGPSVIAETQGDVFMQIRRSVNVVDLTYTLPYLAHACMEVLNCTVRLTKTSCEVWAPTQAPNAVLRTAVALTGLAASQIQVNPTLLGGGLGRKGEVDYVVQAIQVAQAVGKPVKLTWSREEDMAHDQYRPMGMVRVRAGLNNVGAINGWVTRNVSPSILFQRGYIQDGMNDSQATEGLTGLAYGFRSRQAEYVRHPAPVPVGFWRSVGHSINAFAVESAIDEIALVTKTDPLTFRQRLLANDPRSLAVLNAAALLGQWGMPLPAGHARGIAFAASFGSIVAQVAEISQPVAGAITVHKVACVIDCGTAINPNSVEAQMQSGIFHGLSAALWGQVTFKAGNASARNFENYRVLRLGEAPAIAVQIIQSGAAMGGIGEPGVPPIAPAIANAIARLTGNRIRTLPFFPNASRMGDG